MTDKNGATVTVGARCRFFSDLSESWHEGTVRALTEQAYYRPKETRWEARVDDGDPANEDLRTNGLRIAAWVPSDEIEVLP